MTLPDSVDPLEMRVALWGTNTAHILGSKQHKGTITAPRKLLTSTCCDVNSRECAANACSGGGQANCLTRLRGMWTVVLKPQSAPLAPTVAAFAPAERFFLHPEAQACTQALAPKVTPLRCLSDRVVSAIDLRFCGFTAACALRWVKATQQRRRVVSASASCVA